MFRILGYFGKVQKKKKGKIAIPKCYTLQAKAKTSYKGVFIGILQNN